MPDVAEKEANGTSSARVQRSSLAQWFWPWESLRVQRSSLPNGSGHGNRWRLPAEDSYILGIPSENPLVRISQGLDTASPVGMIITVAAAWPAGKLQNMENDILGILPVCYMNELGGSVASRVLACRETSCQEEPSLLHSC